MRGWLWACAVAILALPAAGAGEDIDLYEEAAVQGFLGRAVGQIAFEPPMEDVEDPLQFFDIAPGTPISHEIVWRMIEKMWLTGKVAEVSVLADELPDGSVLLTVSYTHRLRLQSVTIKGNKKLSKKKIVQLIGYRPDMELFPDTLANFEDTLHKEYALRGFPHASFLLETEPLDELDEVKLVITVIEGIPYRIHRLDLGYAAEDPLDGPVPLFELRNALALGDGDIYDQLKLDKGLKAVEARLHEAGYLNAEAGPVETHTDEAGKLTLRIPVKAGPLLRFVIQGNAHLSDEEALAVLDPERILPLNAGLVEEMAIRLVEHYQILGFLDATVVAHQKIDEGGNLLVYRFAVDEGPRVRVTKIHFKGNKQWGDKELRKQVLSFLYEEVPFDAVFSDVSSQVLDELLLSSGYDGPAKTLAQWPPAWIYWAEAYTMAIEHIEKMYVSEGYLNVKVSPPAVKRSDDKLQVTIVVDEGIRTFVDEVTYEGNEAIDDETLAKVTGIREGKPFSGLGVKDAEDALLEEYARNGYRFAAVTTDVAFTDDTTGALIHYGIEEGPQVVVAKIVIRGNAQTSAALIRDRISLKPGTVFTLEKEKQSVNRLHKLGIFRSVSIQMLEPAIAEAEKTIVVEVVERKPQFLGLKGGASTAEGVRGSMEYAYRNLFGYAIDFHFHVALNYRLFFVGVTQEFRDWYVSMPLMDQLERNVGVGLTLPHLPKIGNWVTVEANFAHIRKNSNIYGITTNATGLSLLLGTQKRFNVTLQSGFESSFITANTEITEDLLSLPQCGSEDEVGVGTECLNPVDRRALRVPQTDSPAAFVVTTGKLALDFRDNPFNPTKGFSLNTSVSWIYSPKAVDYTWFEPWEINGERIPLGTYRTTHYGQDVHHEKAISNILKIYTDVTGYISLGTPRVVLMLHAGGGIIVPLPGHTHTFPDRFFYLGGSRTLRGVPEEALCAQDEYQKGQEKDPPIGTCFLGGELMVMYKTELRVMVRGNFGLAFFVDAGNIWHGWDDRYETDGLGEWYNVFADLRYTAGMGIRYITPVGPINLDVGFLLNRREALHDPVGQFHFSIGTF